MESRYVIAWGGDQSFSCTSIRQLMGHMALVFLRGYSEVTVRIERAV